MSFIVVIPARYQSSRLPGKPLLDIAGKPMLQHVVERARKSQARDVVVATDDQRIQAFCQQMQIPVCMTSSSHQSGTDRIEEVCRQLGLDDDEIVVNVQGDEPMIPPAVIDQVAGNLKMEKRAGICTLYEVMQDKQEVLNPNAVKVVVDEHGMALYFSRAMIPFPRDDADSQALDPAQFKRHIGIYAYRVNVLRQFVSWPRGKLEQLEKLEQLRAMEQGVRIHIEACCENMPAGVDTPEDLNNVRMLLA